MTVPSKLIAPKPNCDQSHDVSNPTGTNEVLTNPTTATACKQMRAVVMLKSSPRRRKQQPRHSVRARATFSMFIAVLVLMDLYAILTTDPKQPGPLTKFTGLHPTFNLYLLIVLHLTTLFGGMSKTVNGCRLAMAIAWLFFLFSVVLFMVIPSFIGSYVGSGLAPMRNISLSPEMSTQERFYTAFYMAFGGQLFVILFFMLSIYQMTLIGELLADAHLNEIAAHYAQAGSGEVLLPKP